jgi:hypothetical protein
MFGVVLKALESPIMAETIKNALLAEKYKISDVIGFKVDGSPVEQSTRLCCVVGRLPHCANPGTGGNDE